MNYLPNAKNCLPITFKTLHISNKEKLAFLKITSKITLSGFLLAPM